MPTGEQSHLSQEFRVIKRPLLANAFGKGVTQVKNGKRVMVTSAFPGEGKSFVAINLALSIAAERDHKVLLVDADVARPTIPMELGFEAQTGLMDWLIDGNLDVAQLVLQTDVDKLAILPAGRKHSQATELLASAVDESPARSDQRPVPGPHRDLRLRAPSGHDRDAGAGPVHGPGRHGGGSRAAHQKPRFRKRSLQSRVPPK